MTRDCAVASSLAAVSEGITHVQGTFNGYGERCGNANLVSIIPNLMLKMGFDVHPAGEPARAARHVALRLGAGQPQPWSSQPYVGDSAFAHKGGIHVSAVLKHPETYEHTDPDLVGNHRRVLISELAGQSNILWKAREYGIDLDKNTPDARRILEMLKRMEDEGFQFEGAEASFELLMERALGNHRPYFDLDGYRVIVEEDNGDEEPVAEATVRLRVKGIAEHTAAAGNGPVNALDHALRKALEDFYPNLREMSLLDYKVRILDESKGTGAKTRVLVTSGDGNETWGRSASPTISSRRRGGRWWIRSSTSCGATSARGSADALTIAAKLIEDVARELMARAAIDIPADYREGVRLARDRETGKLPRFVLTEMLRNWDVAAAERRPMCADTGLPRYYVRLGQ